MATLPPGGGMDATLPARVVASTNVLASAPREAVLRAEIRRVEADYAVRGRAGLGGCVLGKSAAARANSEFVRFGATSVPHIRWIVLGATPRPRTRRLPLPAFNPTRGLNPTRPGTAWGSSMCWNSPCEGVFARRWMRCHDESLSTQRRR